MAINTINNWYQMDEQRLASFFDVEFAKGLGSQSVMARLDKFGLNNDLSLSNEMQEIYKAWVKRDGRIERISIKYIVPGDIVLLETGSRVPADLRLLHVHQLTIDQSSITGDALPANKNTFAIKSEVPIEKQLCMAFAGTFVVHGSGWGVVVNHADKMQKNYPKKAQKTKKVSLSFGSNKLRRLNIVATNKETIKLLNDINIVVIDYFLRTEEMLEIIRKVQLGLGINCVFMISTDQISSIKKELPSAQIYNGQDIKNHVSKQTLSMMVDTQFIAGASYADMLKAIATLQQHYKKILWLSDGKNSSQVIGSATLSMLVGNIARDDNLNKADLISINSRPIVLASILHNKK